MLQHLPEEIHICQMPIYSMVMDLFVHSLMRKEPLIILAVCLNSSRAHFHGFIPHTCPVNIYLTTVRLSLN